MNNQTKKLRLLYVLALVGIASIIYSAASLFLTGRELPSALAQTDPFLDRRINQIEQRFYTIESRITRLEHESRLPVISPGSTNNSEIEVRLLRSQVEALQLRVGELECALLKLDERTLSETARRARSQMGQETIDACRKGVNAPVKLSARP